VIAVETPAIIGILNNEVGAERYVEAIGRERLALLSAANSVQAALVATGSRDDRGALDQWLWATDLTIVPVDELQARPRWITLRLQQVAQ
jgi:uncharacterized protein with PIN domain